MASVLCWEFYVTGARQKEAKHELEIGLELKVYTKQKACMMCNRAKQLHPFSCSHPKLIIKI